MRPTQPPSSTVVKVPINDTTNEGLHTELGVFQRRNILLTIQELKLRAALELATGVPWDSVNVVELDGDALIDVVTRNYAHGHNMPMADARKIIEENRVMANPAQKKTAAST